MDESEAAQVEDRARTARGRTHAGGGGWGTRLLVDAMSDHAISALDAAGIVLGWNTGAERITGYSARAMIGRHFSRLFSREDRASGIPEQALEVARLEGRHASEGWRMRSRGRKFWGRTVLNRMQDEDGVLVGFAAITWDVTERMQARNTEDKLRIATFQARKMEAIAQMAGGIAHDFNNLLTIIANNTDRLLSGRAEPERARRLLEGTGRAARRAISLTQRLLAFAGRQAVHPEALDPNSLLRHMEATLRQACGASIEIATDFCPGPRSVWVDREQLESALMNLAQNSRDAMPNGGRLTLKTADVEVDDLRAATMPGVKPGPYVALSVIDTGEGMPTDVLDHALEPFFTTKDVGKGIGLGLSQVHGFVTQCGGHLVIESTMGLGTTVTMLLPCAASTGAEKAPR